MRTRILNRWWRGFAIALAAYAVVGAIVLLTAPNLAGVFLLGAYCIPANSVLPIPHEPGVLFFAPFYDPLWVAAAAMVGSLIAAFADYALVGAALNHPFFRSTRDSRMFRWTMAAMTRFPFAIIVLFSFVPLPISAVRILAPASNYPIARYAAAQTVGRFPRFYMLAWLGHVLRVPTWLTLSLLIALVALMVGGSLRTITRTGDADD